MARPEREAYGTVVVGAGPAGIMAALGAAEAGSVLVVDAASLPRDKSCGGMLNPHALAFLSKLGGVPDSLLLDPSTVFFRYVDRDRGIRRRTSLAFSNVDRRGFDEWLLRQLPEGVEVLGGWALESFVETSAGVRASLRNGQGDAEVTAAHLVGADGARSQVRRGIGAGSTSTYVTLQDRLALDGPLEPYFDCVYIRDVGDGFAYSYVVPKGPEAIVGSVFYPHARRPRRTHERVVALLREDLPALGDLLKREAGVALSVRAAGDVVAGSGSVLLAGEAGGFMSPSSGEGISYAMNSGALAGDAIARGNGDALRLYAEDTAELRRNIRRKLKWLPIMESRTGKYLAGFVPPALVSRITETL
jgi:flavin-dependent dehydrogenase